MSAIIRLFKKSTLGQAAKRAVRLKVMRLESRDVPAPLAPTGVRASGASANSIQISWNPSADPTVTSYNVTEKITHHVISKSGGYTYYTYNLVGSNLTTDSDTVSVVAGSTHSYIVQSLNPNGLSAYSLVATGTTWVAPSLPYGTEFLLTSGAVSSSPVDVVAGTMAQVKLLAAGNPLNYSVTGGTSNATVDSTGVVTYAPSASEVGSVTISFQASNALGSVSTSVPFNVIAPTPGLLTPTIIFTGTSFTYNGSGQTPSAIAVGSDGVTPVSGSFTFVTNGGLAQPLNAGTYSVMAQFTSSDPNYGPASALGTVTVAKAAPTFNYITVPSIAAGTPTTTITGYVWFGSTAPVGESVLIDINGDYEAGVMGNSGNFSVNFPTAALPAGNYTVTVMYPGNSNLLAATDSSGTLTVIPDAPPVITQNPTNHIVGPGDPVSFTAAASGVPTPTAQWQVSTDGGATFTNITGATSTTYTFTAATYYNGFRYRAVFTNMVGTTVIGTATTTSARFLADQPPQVTSVVINGGAAQRSRVTTLDVNFDSPVNLPSNPANAFHLVRQSDNATVNLAAAVTTTARTTVTLTFTGGAVDFGSLADGRYTLTAIAVDISSSAGDLDGTGAGVEDVDYVLVGTPTNGLFRLFGDITGDGTVSAADFDAFRQSFGGVNDAFDFNGDGTVSASDFMQFRQRFGGSI
jgi:hypothetical protein